MGYDTSGAGGVVYVCPHTGERFMGYDLASAKAMALSCSPNCEGALLSGNKSVLTGQPSEQIGSQYWMNANSEGKIINEPPLEVKKALSTAEYAAGWLGTYTSTIPSGIDINTKLNTIQRYPVSLGTAEIWKEVPELAPPTYAQVNGKLASGSVTYNSPGGRPGGESEPAYATGLHTDSSINAGETLGSQNKAGVGTTGVGGVSGILDKVTAAPIALIAIIGVGLLLIFMMGKGLAGAVR